MASLETADRFPPGWVRNRLAEEGLLDFFDDDTDDGHVPLDPDIDDAEGGPDAPRVRRRRTPRLNPDGLALVAAGAVRLEAARHGFSQQDLAGALGISRTAVSARCTGQVAWSLDEIGELARHFGCAVEDLLTEDRRTRRPFGW